MTTDEREFTSDDPLALFDALEVPWSFGGEEDNVWTIKVESMVPMCHPGHEDQKPTKETRMQHMIERINETIKELRVMREESTDPSRARDLSLAITSLEDAALRISPPDWFGESR